MVRFALRHAGIELGRVRHPIPQLCLVHAGIAGVAAEREAVAYGDLGTAQFHLELPTTKFMLIKSLPSTKKNEMRGAFSLSPFLCLCGIPFTWMPFLYIRFAILVSHGGSTKRMDK
jgi:hypothetical protein